MKNEETKKKTKATTTKGKKVSAKATSKTTAAKKSTSVAKEKVETKNNTTVVKEKAETKKKTNDVIVENTKQSKGINENLRLIIVSVLLVGLTAVAFIIGITRNIDKAKYQTHVGINEINVSEYMQIINEDDTSIIYIARPTCSYCTMFEPILKSVLEKYKIGVEYIDISAIATEEEWNQFYNSNEFLSSGEWGTPTLLIYKNKEIIDINSGYVEEANLIEFFKSNKLIGE